MRALVDANPGERYRFTNPGDRDTDDDLSGDSPTNDPNPTTADADYDGILDGIEKMMGMLPSDPDTDGDGVLDGQEVYGYRITVMWYEGKDLKSKDLVVKGCPKATTGPYKAADCSTLLDIDGDGIYDRDEINPRNADAVKGVKDFVAAYGSNKTMMDNAFNPFLRETMPPILTQVTAQSGVEWGSWRDGGARLAWIEEGSFPYSRVSSPSTPRTKVAARFRTASASAPVTVRSP